jgi:type 1 glutamine amidotransferase
MTKYITTPRLVVASNGKDCFLEVLHRSCRFGRVLYCSLAHYNEVRRRPDIQKTWLEAIKWSTGMTDSR